MVLALWRYRDWVCLLYYLNALSGDVQKKLMERTRVKGAKAGVREKGDARHLSPTNGTMFSLTAESIFFSFFLETVHWKSSPIGNLYKTLD